MVQVKKKIYRWPIMNMPVSYKIGVQDRMTDARNVMSNQNVLETRNGTSRYNATAIDSLGVSSVSYYKDDSGNRYVLAKAGRHIYKVTETGAAVELFGGFTLDEDELDVDYITASNTQLTIGLKHRAVTFLNRHIIAAQVDGLYQYDGTDFTQLGQAAPTVAPTVAASGAGGTLPTATYQVAYTFYDSAVGFETNIGSASANQAITLGQQIDVSAMSVTADNANIDKKRIYVKNITSSGAWLFYSEIALATATATINTALTSTLNPPTTHAAPIAGGAKYLAIFGNKLVYSGNSSFPSDVFFSDEYLADAWDDTSAQLVLNMQGNGPITGIGVGHYNQDSATPFLCMFKRNRIEIYSEINGNAVQSIISENIGCISHDTIKMIDGDLVFMSTMGWHVIHNGRLKEERVAKDDLSDIFTKSGFIYELNKSRYNTFFSVFYPPLNQYMTFISEGSSTDLKKCYNFEGSTNGFRPYDFPLNIFDACLAEDSTGEDILLFASQSGFILKHSVKEARNDILNGGTTQAIRTYANMYWIGGMDMDSSYNFGAVIFRALESVNAVTAKYYANFQLSLAVNESFDFNSDESGFILDVSRLDEASLGDGRTIVRYAGGVYLTAQALLIAFSQNIAGANIGLIEGQLDVSKNGSIN